MKLSTLRRYDGRKPGALGAKALVFAFQQAIRKFSSLIAAQENQLSLD